MTKTTRWTSSLWHWKEKRRVVLFSSHLSSLSFQTQPKAHRLGSHQVQHFSMNVFCGGIASCFLGVTVSLLVVLASAISPGRWTRLGGAIFSTYVFPSLPLRPEDTQVRRNIQTKKADSCGWSDDKCRVAGRAWVSHSVIPGCSKRYNMSEALSMF